jgi:hypothetical protein
MWDARVPGWLFLAIIFTLLGCLLLGLTGRLLGWSDPSYPIAAVQQAKERALNDTESAPRLRKVLSSTRADLSASKAKVNALQQKVIELEHARTPLSSLALTPREKDFSSPQTPGRSSNAVGGASATAARSSPTSWRRRFYPGSANADHTDRLERLEGSVATALELLERSTQQMARLERIVQRSLSTESTLVDASVAYDRRGSLGMPGVLRGSERRQDSATFSAGSSEDGAPYGLSIQGGGHSHSNVHREQLLPPHARSNRKHLRSSLPAKFNAELLRGYRSADDVNSRESASRHRASSVEAQWGELPRVGFGRGLSGSFSGRSFSLERAHKAFTSEEVNTPYYHKFREAEPPNVSPPQHRYGSPPTPGRDLSEQQLVSGDDGNSHGRGRSPRRTPGRATVPFAKPDLPYLAAMETSSETAAEHTTAPHPHPSNASGHPSRRRIRASRPSVTAFPRASSDNHSEDSPEADVESQVNSVDNGDDEVNDTSAATANDQQSPTSAQPPPRRASAMFSPSAAPWADHSVTQTVEERDAASRSHPAGRRNGSRGGRGPPPRRGLSPRRPSSVTPNGDPLANPSAEPRHAFRGPPNDKQPLVRPPAATVDLTSSRYVAQERSARDDNNSDSSD